MHDIILADNGKPTLDKRKVNAPDFNKLESKISMIQNDADMDDDEDVLAEFKKKAKESRQKPKVENIAEGRTMKNNIVSENNRDTKFTLQPE